MVNALLPVIAGSSGRIGHFTFHFSKIRGDLLIDHDSFAPSEEPSHLRALWHANSTNMTTAPSGFSEPWLFSHASFTLRTDCSHLCIYFLVLIQEVAMMKGKKHGGIKCPKEHNRLRSVGTVCVSVVFLLHCHSYGGGRHMIH